MGYAFETTWQNLKKAGDGYSDYTVFQIRKRAEKLLFSRE